MDEGEQSAGGELVAKALQLLATGPVDLMVTEGMTAYVDDCENVTSEIAALIEPVSRLVAWMEDEPESKPPYDTICEAGEAMLALCAVLQRVGTSRSTP